MVQDGFTAGLLQKHPLATRLAAVIETATSTCLSATDDDDQATAKLHVQKAAQAADEAWQAINRRIAGTRRRNPDHRIPPGRAGPVRRSAKRSFHGQQIRLDSGV